MIQKTVRTEYLDALWRAITWAGVVLLPKRISAAALRRLMENATSEDWVNGLGRRIEASLDEMMKNMASRTRVRGMLHYLIVNWRRERDPVELLWVQLRLVGRYRVAGAASKILTMIGNRDLMGSTVGRENLHRRALRALLSLCEDCTEDVRSAAVTAFTVNLERIIPDPVSGSSIAAFAGVCWRGLYELGMNPLGFLDAIFAFHKNGMLREELGLLINNFVRAVSLDAHCKMLQEKWHDIHPSHREEYLNLLSGMRYRMKVGLELELPQHPGRQSIMFTDMERGDVEIGFLRVDISKPGEFGIDFLDRLAKSSYLLKADDRESLMQRGMKTAESV